MKEEEFSVDNINKPDEFHLEKIGKLVEEMESLLRSHLDTIYVGRTKETIFSIRSIDGTFALEKKKRGLASDFL